MLLIGRQSEGLDFVWCLVERLGLSRCDVRCVDAVCAISVGDEEQGFSIRRIEWGGVSAGVIGQLFGVGSVWTFASGGGDAEQFTADIEGDSFSVGAEVSGDDSSGDGLSVEFQSFGVN